MRRVSPGGLVLRAVMVLGPVAALLAGVPQGYRPPLWLVVLTACTALASAAVPDHPAGALAPLIVVAWWALRVGGALPVSSVVAAAGLVAGHLAATVAAYGPSRIAPDAGIVWMWARRGLLVWAVSALTWFVVAAETGRATSAAYWVAGLALALGLVAAATRRFPAAGDRVV